MSEVDARFPERHKRAGVCYAVSDDGLELPVIDVTHPAFAIAVGSRELEDIADRTVKSLARSARAPAFVQRMLRRRSILVRQTIESSGGFLSGMATYLQKLGPANLGRVYAGRLDRRVAGSIGPVSNRLRLQETARLIADGLGPLLSAAAPGAAIHLVNIGGGPAMDSVNALILLSKEHRPWMANRQAAIHVFDIDRAGPRFGARALAALGGAGAPLEGFDIRFEYVPYDWSEPAVLRDALGRLALAGAAVGISSEGGLFEYGSDEEILANLEVLRDATPRGACCTVSVILDDRVGRVMKGMSRMGLQLRTVDGVAALAARAGWTLAGTSGRAFVHAVVRLQKV